MAIRLRILVIVALFSIAPIGALRADEGTTFFENRIRPLLTTHCQACHQQSKVKGGLLLTSRADLLRGGDTGPAIVPGKPDESLIMQMIGYAGETKMPPKGKLPDADIAAFRKWISIGAPWPATAAITPAIASKSFSISDEQRRFWSFQPVKPVTPPTVKNTAWPITEIDRFILAKLEAESLKPALPLNRAALIRRVTFDLTGLPPTPEAVAAFLADQSPDAYDKLVDRLLASPAYGERWGRHWLDVVRYADNRDSRGLGGDMDIGEAWRYRDWVVKALNADMPYDQFVRMQIAGDRLPGAIPGDINPDGLVATGLLTIGEWGTGDADKEKMLTDVIDDQVHIVSKAFMGLTVACARCHDHKFDPISQADYYGLAGIFFSSKILPDPGPKTNGSPLLRTSLETQAEKAARADRDRKRTAAIATLEKARQQAKLAFVQSMQAESEKYFTAAKAAQIRPMNQPLEAFAKARGLHPFALARWMERLPLAGAFTQREMIANGSRVKIHGPNEFPVVVLNPTDQPINELTYRHPAKSVSVHPGPTQGAGIRWISPVKATVKVAGVIVDNDGACGDGVSWRIERVHEGERVRIKQGAIANGGQVTLDSLSMDVQPGDAIELTIDPTNGHICDTTTVNLTIRSEAESPSRSWDLTKDVLAQPTQSSPIWQFFDAGSSVARIPLNPKTLTQLPLDAMHPFWPQTVADEVVLPEATRTELARLQTLIEKELVATPAPVALAIQEGGTPRSMFPGIQDVPIHIRGSYTRLGPLVPRHFPTILAGEQPPKFDGSGRLELANWIATPTNPLTARVIVNRLWQHHFGAGLVRTSSNFGKLGEKPSHPELLDYLANQLISEKWSLKAMHRLMVRSAVYRQASVADEATRLRDPENRLLARQTPRRLEAEAIRDSLLAIAVKLDPQAGGVAFADLNTPRRTLYLRTVRSDRSGFGSLFDAADPETSVESRTQSTVAPQALFLLNHPFAQAQAQALAARLLREATTDPERIQRAYHLLYARDASPEEIAIGRKIVSQPGTPQDVWTGYTQVLLCANEFMIVD